MFSATEEGWTNRLFTKTEHPDLEKCECDSCHDEHLFHGVWDYKNNCHRCDDYIFDLQSKNMWCYAHKRSLDDTAYCSFCEEIR